MGYFNLFYKITRTIDFFTRKRNRKFIIALCLIGAFVFFSPSMTYAQYTNLDSQNLQTVRTKITEIDSTLDTYMGDIYSQVSLSATYEGWIYQNSGAISSAVQTTRDYVLTIRGYVNDIKASAEHIDSDLHDLLDEVTALSTKIDTVQDTLDNIESILNSIGEDINTYGQLNHEDLEELKDLIKDYLYGDADLYDVTSKSVKYILPKDFQDSDTTTITGTFMPTNSSDYNTYYFPLKEGYRYYIEWQKVGTYAGYGVRYGYTNNVPARGAQYGDCTRWGVNDPNGIDITSDGTYKYFYITLNQQFAILTSIKSTYNEGQEMGVYGGLTNIQNTEINQGEQTRDTISQESQTTRDTITSTDYVQGDVSINSDSINNVDTTQTDGLFTTIFTNFNNAATGGVDTITIPLPYNSGNLVLHSNLVSSHLGALSTLVSAFWYFVFGFYAFKFVNNLLHNIKDGSILDGFKNNNEVITQDML